jgi:hypothetical protein
MPHILKWKDVRPTDLRYHQPRNSGAHDGFSVRVEVFDRATDQYHPFIHVGPMMNIPFGLTRKEGPNGSGPRFNCDMTYPGVSKSAGSGEYESNGEPDSLEYLQFTRRIDEQNKAKAVTESPTWFKKQISKDIIEEFYFHNVMNPRDEQKYSPTFCAKLWWIGEDFKTEFYNQRKQPIKFDDIGRGLRVVPLLETRGLWFAGKSFGMSFRVLQLMVFERDQFKGCAIDAGFAMDNEHPEHAIADHTVPGGLAPGFVMPAGAGDDDDAALLAADAAATKRPRFH